ncbi:Rax1 protein [Hanseniaspora uvarum]|nr:Rax1 protein [Hanseniaspora uvarum]
MLFKQPQYTTSMDGIETYGRNNRKRVVSEMNNLLDQDTTANNEINFDSDLSDDEADIIDGYNQQTSASQQNPLSPSLALPTLKEIFKNPDRPEPINLWNFYKFVATSPNARLINLLDFYIDYRTHLRLVSQDNNKSFETVQTITLLANDINIKDLKLNSSAIFQTYFLKNSNKFIMELDPSEELDLQLPFVAKNIYNLLDSELYPLFLKEILYKNIHSVRTSIKYLLIGVLLVWLGFWAYYTLVFLKINRAFRLIPLFFILLGTYMIINIALLKVDLTLYCLDLIQLQDYDTDSDNLLKIGKEKSFKVGEELTFNSFGKKAELVKNLLNLVYGGTFINYKKQPGIKYILKKKLFMALLSYISVAVILLVILLAVPGRRL